MPALRQKDIMSVPSQENQAQPQTAEKELNFRKQEAMFQRQLEQEREGRLAAEEKATRLEQERAKSREDDDDDDTDPYVDRRKLDKKLSQFEKNMEQKIEAKAESKARALIAEEKQSSYLRENSDFNHIMSSDVVQKFADKYPKLAENILRMPEGFERQKLVYETIKAMGIDKPLSKEPSVQEKIDANRKSPYYQPTSVGAAPYASVGDFSPAGQKNAYDKMVELKARLRL